MTSLEKYEANAQKLEKLAKRIINQSIEQHDRSCHQGHGENEVDTLDKAIGHLEEAIKILENKRDF